MGDLSGSKTVEENKRQILVYGILEVFPTIAMGDAVDETMMFAVSREESGQMRKDGDVAVRLGGKELIVFLPNTDFTEARQIAERIRLAIVAAGVPHSVLSPDAVVSASLGVATSSTSDCTAPH